jgi:hypothetical protein
MDTNNLKDYQKEVFKEFEELSHKIDSLVTFKNNDEYFLHLKDILNEYVSEIKRENIEGVNSFTLDELRRIDELKTKSREYVLVDSQIEIMFNYRETLIERIVTWGFKREEFLFD